MSDLGLSVCGSCPRKETYADTCLPSIGAAELRDSERVLSNTIPQECMYYVDPTSAKSYYRSKCEGLEYETQILGCVVDKLGNSHYRLRVDRINENLFAYTANHSGVLKIAFIVPSKDYDYFVQVKVPEHIYNPDMLNGNRNRPVHLKNLGQLPIQNIDLESYFLNYIAYKQEGFPFSQTIIIQQFITPDGMIMNSNNGGFHLDLVEETDGWANVYALYDAHKPDATRFLHFDKETQMFRQINRKQKRQALSEA